MRESGRVGCRGAVSDFCCKVYVHLRVYVLPGSEAVTPT